MLFCISCLYLIGNLQFLYRAYQSLTIVYLYGISITIYGNTMYLKVMLFLHNVRLSHDLLSVML